MGGGVDQYLLTIAVLLGVVLLGVEVESLFHTQDFELFLFLGGIGLLLVAANLQPKKLTWMKNGYVLVFVVGAMLITYQLLTFQEFMIRYSLGGASTLPFTNFAYKSPFEFLVLKTAASILLVFAGMVGYFRRLQEERKTENKKAPVY